MGVSDKIGKRRHGMTKKTIWALIVCAVSGAAVYFVLFFNYISVSTSSSAPIDNLGYMVHTYVRYGALYENHVVFFYSVHYRFIQDPHSGSLVSNAERLTLWTHDGDIPIQIFLNEDGRVLGCNYYDGRDEYWDCTSCPADTRCFRVCSRVEDIWNRYDNEFNLRSYNR